MTKALVAVGLLVVFGACSKSSTQSASPTPTSATAALGCDFTLPNAVRNRELTQSSIDTAVAGAPAAIRSDLRMVYEASMKYQNDIKAAQAAPTPQRPAMLQAASKDLSNADYRAAARRLSAYFALHCSRLRGRGPSATP